MGDDRLEILCHCAVQAGATDMHLLAGRRPLVRVNARLRELEPADWPVLSAEDVGALATQMYARASRQAQLPPRDVDFALSCEGVGRFRVNVHRQRGSVAVALRVIPPRTWRLEELNLPDAVRRLAMLPRGLVLVTGDAGSGKSTTLAAMIEHMNDSQPWHVITLEDPVEYLIPSRSCAIEQREIGLDISSFHEALRSVVRQDPDVVLVGEMRDLETVSAVLTIAETGHLVLSTLHTQGAAETVQRIVDLYPGTQQTQVRSQLARTLQGVICQSLLPRRDGTGLVPAVEIMICTPAVRHCIRDNRLYELPNLIETGQQYGMQTRDRALAELARSGEIDEADALAEANDPDKLRDLLTSAGRPRPRA